jgi:hypothetical protein
MAEKEIILKYRADFSEISAASSEMEAALRKTADGAKIQPVSKEAIKDVKDGTKAVSDLEKSIKDSDKSTMSATGRLRAMKRELVELDEGSQRFKELSKEAAILQDKIGDAAARVRVLASDTGKLDAAVQGVQGVAGAFSVAQGAAAAFGADNEDLVRTLAKVQGSMALVNGLQQVATVLNKDSAFSVIFLSKAKAALSTVIGTTTGALKLFRIALIATGIGALVALIGTIIAKWDDWKDSILGFIKIALFPFIWALEQLGIIDDENTKKAKENAEARRDGILRESKAIGEKKKAIEDYYEFEERKAKAAGKEVEDIERRKQMAVLKTLKANLEALQLIENKNVVVYAEIAKMQQEIAQLEKDIRQDSIVDKIKQDKRQQELEAENAKKMADIRKAAADKARAQAEQLEQLRLGLIADAQEREIAIVNDKYKKLLADAVGNAALISALEETQGNNIQAIKDKYLEQERQRQEKHNADIIALQRQQDEALITLIQDGAERKEAEIALAFERRIEKLQELGLLTADVEAQLILEQEGALMELRDELAKDELDAEKARQMALLEQEKAYLDARVAMAQDTLSALSSLISISNLSAEEQAAFQQQLAIFEIAISTAASLANTILGASKAAEATGPLAPFTLAGFIATGVATVLGAFAQANQLVNRPVPKFATGVEWLNGAGTATSDSIPAYLSKGERVVPTHLNERYWDEYTAMHNGWYDKLVATKYIEPAITSLLSGTGVSSSSWRGDNIVGAISGSTKTGKKQHKQLLTAIKSNHKKSLRKW